MIARNLSKEDKPLKNEVRKLVKRLKRLMH